MAHLGKVIAVRPKSAYAARLIGFEVAESMEDAIETARGFVGGKRGCAISTARRS